MMRFAISLMLALLLIVQPASPSVAKTAEEYFSEAVLMHNSGNITEAVRLYTKATDTDHQFIMAWQMRAVAWQKLRQFQKAISDYSTVIEIGDPAFQAVGYFNRGIVRNLAGQYEEAIPDFTKAISIDRKMGAAFFHRGIARIKTGDHSGTIDDFIQGARLGDPDAERWLDKVMPGWRETIK